MMFLKKQKSKGTGQEARLALALTQVLVVFPHWLGLDFSLHDWLV